MLFNERTVVYCTMLNKQTNIMNNAQIKSIKEGQRITFNAYGTTYTRKVQQVVTALFHDRISFNINKIGSGTGFDNVESQDVILVK